MKYDHKKIEAKWQRYWAKNKTNEVDLGMAKKPFYNLMMFPYPSAEGLHVGNMYAFVHSDAYGRFIRLKGFDVFEPIGLDGFGIHSENYAIKMKQNIQEVSKRTEKHFYEQLHMIGNQYDWGRTVETYKPDYYKWTQWIFVQMFKKGLAYQAESYVNWCPSCKTVLSDEQVVSGECERCGSVAERKMMKQWFFKITAYAEKLLKNLEWIDWTERTKIAQRDWIGKSEGAQFKMSIQGAGCLKAKYSQILLATNNLSKKARVEKLLKAIGVETKVLTPKDLGIEIIESKEEGNLFENAKEKAELYRGKTDLPVLGIDTGFFMEGEEIDSVKVKRNALEGKNEKELTQEEIGRLIHEYYKNIVKKRGGKVDAYWQDVAALLLPDGTAKVVDDKREVIITDQVKGEIDIYFPLRSLYISKAAGKYIADQTEEDELIEQAPFVETLKKLLCAEELFVEVFTTRLDTVFGMTYAVIAPEHPILANGKLQIVNRKEVEKYIEEAKKKSELQRMTEEKEKTGVELKGVKLINPFNNEAIPVFVGDYVLGHYGTGAVMAVPGHDERDYEFAKKHGLLIKEVVVSKNQEIVGVGALIKDKEGNFLFQERDNNTKINPGMIAPFGGAIEAGESHLDALARELKEEINLEIDRTKTIAIGKFKSHAFQGKFINLFYIEAIDCKKIKLQEGSRVVKFSLDKALENDKVTDFTKEVIRYFKAFDYLVLTEDGILIDSDKYSGLTSDKAREKMTEWLGKNKIGSRKINYRLRDWCISRQRYWGPPIPIIYCEKDGAVPVPEKDLPVKLPKTDDYLPKNDGLSPLARNEKFVKTTCPKCDGPAKRETDVSDTFLDSAWYYFRYPSVSSEQAPFDSAITKKWLPVSMYIGGQEHAVLHLLYSRFITMVFRDLGLIDFEEPYKRFFAHGLLIKEGAKMSKSKGNVINPDEYIKKFGADSVRFYLMFLGDVRVGGDWRDSGMQGMSRFVNRVWNIAQEIIKQKNKETDAEISKFAHKAIKRMGDDLEKLKFNTAIAAIMEYVNALYDGWANKKQIGPDVVEILAKLLSPFAPFLAEEIWNQLGHKKSIFTEHWPEYDPALVKDETIELVVQINGKVRARLYASADIAEEEAKKLALADEGIKKWLSGKELKKVIFVKGRLINIVI